VVTVNLDDVYASAKKTKKGRAKLYEKYGGIMLRENLVDSGITGLRAFGVDYSGKTGAPCLIALVDRIEGSKKAMWALPFAFGSWGVGKFQMENVDDVAKKLGYAGMTKKYYKEMMAQVERWKLPGDRGRQSPYKPFADAREETLKTLKLEGNTFTITKDGATLRGTFVAPAKVTLSTDDLEKMHMGAKRTILYRACAGLFATDPSTGSGQAADYLCIMTIQKGDPPEVKVKGKGLDAVVTVGKQTIRFDGEKIVFGE
jgi:hypothetical protein